MTANNDPTQCPLCLSKTARFDPVQRIWRCPCGWRDRPRGRTLLVAVTVVVLFSGSGADNVREAVRAVLFAGGCETPVVEMVMLEDEVEVRGYCKESGDGGH